LISECSVTISGRPTSTSAAISASVRPSSRRNVSRSRTASQSTMLPTKENIHTSVMAIIDISIADGTSQRHEPLV
jgi:hypothetical protein